MIHETNKLALPSQGVEQSHKKSFNEGCWALYPGV